MGLVPGHPGRQHMVGAPLEGTSGIAIIIALAAVVVGLVALRHLADRNTETRRYFLNTFWDHIPDNVYFKDRRSRFLRINRAMADYFGLADPAQAVNKTDSDMFSSEHAGQALEDVATRHRLGERQRRAGVSRRGDVNLIGRREAGNRGERAVASVGRVCNLERVAAVLDTVNTDSRLPIGAADEEQAAT